MDNNPSATRWRVRCHFHYLREAAKPIAAADLHAKKELRKQVRGVRPIERSLEGRTDEEAEAVRGYCLAGRSALTDDGRPPLDADGLKLKERLQNISDSIARIEQKRASRRTQPAPTPGTSWTDGDRRHLFCHPTSLYMGASGGPPPRQHRAA